MHPVKRKRKCKYTSTEFVFDNFEYCKNKTVKGITYLECLQRKRGCHARGKLDEFGKFTLTKPHHTHVADPIAYSFRMYRAHTKYSKGSKMNVIDWLKQCEKNPNFYFQENDDIQMKKEPIDNQSTKLQGMTIEDILDNELKNSTDDFDIPRCNSCEKLFLTENDLFYHLNNRH